MLDWIPKIFAVTWTNSLANHSFWCFIELHNVIKEAPRTIHPPVKFLNPLSKLHGHVVVMELVLARGERVHPADSLCCRAKTKRERDSNYSDLWPFYQHAVTHRCKNHIVLVVYSLQVLLTAIYSGSPHQLILELDQMYYSVNVKFTIAL